MSNTKPKVTITVVVSGLNAVLELRRFPSMEVMATTMPRTRKHNINNPASVLETCEHLADGARELSKDYRIIMPATYKRSLVKRELISDDMIEADTVHGYESIRLEGAAQSADPNAQPKPLKKSDICRSIIRDHISDPADDVIALIAKECELPVGLAKKYYQNNLPKVQATAA